MVYISATYVQDLTAVLELNDHSGNSGSGFLALRVCLAKWVGCGIH